MSFEPAGSGDACVRLLTDNGTVGCATPGRSPAEGVLRRLDTLLPDPADYPDGTAFLVPPALLAGFLQQCQDSPALAARVRGVLVAPAPAPDYSQAAAAPLAPFALYPNHSYAWNPTGAGLNGMALPFPVYLLDDATTQNAQGRVDYNSDQGWDDATALNYARMSLHMEASGNSTGCITGQTCLPLGGHSVLATLPPLPPPPATGDGLPAVWVLAQFDSAALFHDATVGADAPVSGLIAMLAAAQLLGSANASAALAGAGGRYRRRLVFAAMAGEPWGLMGSKRLLWELASGPSNSSLAAFAVAGNGSVAGVFEVTQVGRARQAGDGVRFYAHTPAPGTGGPPAELLATLQAAAGNTTEPSGGVAVAPASAAAPGLPPTASAGSLVRVGGASVPAVLLSGFDATFQGSTFQSHYDAEATVDEESIVAAAVVLARAVHTLALGDASEPPLPVDYAGVRATVGALTQCLLNSTVGLTCPLAAAMMTPVAGGRVAHYIGILRTLTADPQTPDAAVKSDTERFLWNYLAFATSHIQPGTNSSSGSSSGSGSSGSAAGSGGAIPLQRCQPLNATSCPPGMACAGSRSLPGEEGLGYCLNATMRFAPAYSTRLACDGCDGSATLYEYRWGLSNASVQWERQYSWPPDPVWTESNWPTGTPALTLYLREAPATEWALLGAGLAVATASLTVTLGVAWAYSRKLKQQ